MLLYYFDENGDIRRGFIELEDPRRCLRMDRVGEYIVSTYIMPYHYVCIETVVFLNGVVLSNLKRENDTREDALRAHEEVIALLYLGE